MLKVINFPFCNFHSITRYLNKRNINFESVNTSKDVFDKNDTILIPGVGTFAEGCSFLDETGLNHLIRQHGLNGGSIIGICLGMQLLLEKSEESPGYEGIGLISGTCKKMPKHETFRIPHIGWNSLLINKNNDLIYNQLWGNTLKSKSDFYFVHSFYCNLSNENLISGWIDHPIKRIPASLSSGKITGYQFHPEKSGKTGYKLLDKTISFLF